MMEPSIRDWPEDFPHENGNYMCRCFDCKEEFIGHKRRVTCWSCAHPPPNRWVRLKRWLRGGYEYGTVHNVGAIRMKMFVADVRRHVRSGVVETRDERLDTWYEINRDHWRMFHPKDHVPESK